VDEAYKKTKEILLNHKEELTQVAELLLKKEVIFKEDIEQILGKRPESSMSVELKTPEQVTGV
jgi:cell division protease FtsH